MKRRFTVGSVALGILAAACGTPEKGAPAASASVPAAAASTSTGPASSAEGSSAPAIVVLAKGKDLLLAGNNGDGVLLGGRTGLTITAGVLADRTSLHRGLENPRWTERHLYAPQADSLFIAGKRDPASLMQGDEMLYMENRAVPGDVTVFRFFRGDAWIYSGGLEQGEELVAVARYKNGLVGIVELVEAHDYRFDLITATSEPQAPGRLAKAEEPAPAEPPSGPTAEPTADASAAPSVSAAPPSPPPAAPPPPPPPADPNVPNPDEAAGCTSRITPRAADGRPNGELMVAGNVCPGVGALWVEHFPVSGEPKYEKLTDAPKGRLTLVMPSDGVGWIAEIGGRYLARGENGQFSKVEAPGAGNIVELSASPAGKLWIIVGDEIWSRRPTDGAWKKLPLPSGTSPTTLMPSDSDVPFVLAGDTLLGPEASAAGEVIDVSGGATSLCKEPYVIVDVKATRAKKYPDTVAKVKGAGVANVTLLHGYRGMLGADPLQAKTDTMADARRLAEKIGGADIVCGPPRNPKKLEAE